MSNYLLAKDAKTNAEYVCEYTDSEMEEIFTESELTGLRKGLVVTKRYYANSEVDYVDMKAAARKALRA